MLSAPERVMAKRDAQGGGSLNIDRADNDEERGDRPRAQSAHHDPTPLVVDLDGTLICGDSLWEGLFALPKISLPSFFAACMAVRGGRAALKQAVAARRTPVFNQFRFNQEVVEFVRQEAAARPVILATAANERVAAVIAEGLDVFSLVIASGEANRKAAGKLSALKLRLKENGLGEDFDYIGDNVADRILWTEARHAYVVAISDSAAAQLSDGVKIARRFGRPRLTIRDAIFALRPFRWIAILAVFLPILAAGGAQDGAWSQALAAYVSLCLLASAAGLLDDILDIHEDRAATAPRRKIFAEGLVEIPVGVSIALAMLALGIGIAISSLAPIVTALIGGCFASAMAYSLVIRPGRWTSAAFHGALGAVLIMIGAQIGQAPISWWLAPSSAAIFSVFGYVGAARKSGGG